MNAYEVRQAWCLLQVKLCDPCLSALKWSVYHAYYILYKCSALPLPLPLTKENMVWIRCPYLDSISGLPPKVNGDFLVHRIHLQ